MNKVLENVERFVFGFLLGAVAVAVVQFDETEAVDKKHAKTSLLLDQKRGVFGDE